MRPAPFATNALGAPEFCALIGSGVIGNLIDKFGEEVTLTLAI